MFQKSLASTPDSVEDSYGAALAYSLLPPSQVAEVIAHWENSTRDVTSAGFVVRLTSNSYRYISFTRETGRLVVIVEKHDVEPVHLYKRALTWSTDVRALNARFGMVLPTEHDAGWRTLDGKNVEQPQAAVVVAPQQLTGVSPAGTATFEDNPLFPR